MEDTYEQQVEANKTFFEDAWEPGDFDEVAEEDRPQRLEKVKGEVYDITGFNASTVVALLLKIVNSKSWTWQKTFYLVIKKEHGDDQYTEIFKLQCTYHPVYTPNQPGNGIIEIKERVETTFRSSTYEELNEQLEDACDEKTFANYMLNLFENNEIIHTLSTYIAEAYLLLLFEIARRLVKREDKTDVGKELDELPAMGCAIARALYLLYRGRCTFKDFFQKKGTLHCFSYEAADRKKAIDLINEKFEAAVSNMLSPQVELEHTYGKKAAAEEETEGEKVNQQLEHLHTTDHYDYCRSDTSDSSDEDENTYNYCRSDTNDVSDEGEDGYDDYCRSDASDGSDEGEDGYDDYCKSDTSGGSDEDENSYNHYSTSDTSDGSDEDENSVCEKKSNESEQDSHATDDSTSGTSDESSGMEID